MRKYLYIVKKIFIKSGIAFGVCLIGVGPFLISLRFSSVLFVGLSFIWAVIFICCAIMTIEENK